jgi:hypothetical protein
VAGSEGGGEEGREEAEEEMTTDERLGALTHPWADCVDAVVDGEGHRQAGSDARYHRYRIPYSAWENKRRLITRRSGRDQNSLHDAPHGRSGSVLTAKTGANR